MYYDSGNEPVEALGRFARRVGSGGALYIGGGIGVEKVGTKNGDRYQLTRASGKSGESFSGPLSAVMRAFSVAGGSTLPDSPGGTTAVADPAAAARLHELRDMERQTRKDIDRVQARINTKTPAPVAGIPTPNSIDESSYEMRRLAELKRDLAQIQSESEALKSSGKVEEVEQVRPGTNFTKIPPQNVARLKGIIEHYKKMAHPFTACVRDQIKHGLSQDHANRRCAVVKDLGEGTTKWRKGGKVKEEFVEERIGEARQRMRTIDSTLGAGAAVELAETAGSIGSNVLDAIGEGAFADLTVLALAGDPYGQLWESVRGGTDIPDPLAESFNEKLHPRAHHGAHGGEFVRKLFGAHDATGKAGVVTPRRKDPIPEGSGRARPTGVVTTAHVPRAPGAGAEGQRARETRNVNQRKLTEKELPKAVGKGPWDAGVADAVKGLRDGKIADTDTHYRTPQGNYTPERIELHARIIRALLQGAGAHPGDKQAIFLAGGPASGKSTLLREGHVKPPTDAVEINPDIIKTMLPEYKALVAAGDPEASSKVHEESSHVAKWLQNLAMAREHHVVVDGTGNSEPGKFAEKIQRTVDHGYTSSVHYATIPTEEALKRAEERANNPKSDSYGRRVPTGYLRTAHSHVSRSFAHDVSKMKDVSVHVFDTTGKKPKKLYEKHAGGAETIKHKAGYDRFVAKMHEVKRG